MFDYDKDSGEIWFYDYIGPAWAGMIDASTFGAAMRAMDGKDVTIRVASNGGSVFEAHTMYNEIKRYSGKVTVVIESIAASAASYFILAADEIRAAKNAMVMIHKALTATMGNADDHRKSIEVLDKADDILVDLYAEKTKKPKDEIVAALAAETWFTAKEAKAFGLVDAIGEAIAVTAQVPDGLFNNTPDFLKVQPQAGTRTEYPAAREAARIKARMRTSIF